MFLSVSYLMELIIAFPCSNVLPTVRNKKKVTKVYSVYSMQILPSLNIVLVNIKNTRTRASWKPCKRIDH